jgi:sterol 3beta-glucosyltransferase
MHVMLVTGGTRGDIDPYVALGLGLRDAGYRVSVATNEDFEPLVTSRGLAFRPLRGSFRALVESPAGREWLESGNSLKRYRETYLRLFDEPIAKWTEDMHAAAAEGDAVVFHPFWCGAFHMAEKRGVPAVCVAPYPVLPTGLQPPGFAPWVPAWPWLRRWMAMKVLTVFGEMVAPYHQTAREQIGLAPWKGVLFWPDMAALGVPFVHILSPFLSPRPADWPDNAHVTGHCQLPMETAWTPPEALADFLAAGPPPVYVGFGSMTGFDPAELTALVADAIRQAGVRAVVCTGWGGVEGQVPPEGVFFVDDVPHEWLFARVAATVHHGGVGTTTASLRAGRPTQVVPFFGDQPVWGRRVHELGAGPPPLPKGKLTAARLAERIAKLASDPSYAEGARRAQEAMQAEDGVGRAVDVISRHLS